MSYPVGAVAELAGVTVRTLHHYDEIGLLSPSSRSNAGYRRYGDGDLDRLQRILLYRELGFSLEAIAAVIDDPDHDAVGHLRRQRDLLLERIEHLRRMVASVEQVLEAKEMGNALTPEEKFEIFGHAEPPGYAEEAGRRWGHTKEWQTARERTADFGEREWRQAEDTRRAWVATLLGLLDSGAAADGVAAMDLAEEHRRMLGEFMGECGYELHRHITELYVTEPAQLGFLVREPDQRPGVGEFIRDAAEANAARHT
ncbi:MerR family transcriptional regulator [Amycolatopsis cihanbeyliensis]|uniref:DNA-binding transcriptional MerR regulator n=1 Tax=Amycolatopsis cihanbeyliensis TaxID=1128664 RepID=A0A542DCG6_AMYCI|nr:MerR family transcriptional regulator [Amycolatopsis cihanbeyliensis]TQJ00764.1 DNA-binding transcriptional MerR regulator [Amycolatopsis cihanbeyliensis]